MKTPNQADGYFAVRRGRHVRDCIFLSYPTDHVFNFAQAEYKVFDTLQEAETYLKEGGATLETSPAAKDTTTSPHPVSILPRLPTVQNRVPEVDAPAASTKKAPTPKSAAASKKRKDPPLPAADAPAAGMKKSAAASKKRKAPPRRKPTKKWETNFQQLKDAAVDGTIPEPQDPKLKQWVKKQNEEYNKYREGKESAMFDNKIQRLREIGFVFRRDTEKAPGSSARKGRTIYKNWEESLAKLKTYMETHNGSWDIDRKEDPKLREWVVEQRAELKRMIDGKNSFMSEAKLQRLRDIGVELTCISWKDRIAQLQAFKNEHGHLNIPRNHETLGNWSVAIRNQAKSFVSTGKATKDINAERVAELKALGFDILMENKNRKSADDWNAEFDPMMDKLRAFKQEFGDCRVMNTHKEWRDLFNWAQRIRIEYKKLSKKESNCRLTAFQLQQLTDFGFAFRQKEPYRTWEQRVDELRKYKEEHGSIGDITVSHPEFGEFVSRQRKQYREWCDGKKTAMTDKRVQILRDDLGFNFNTENWRDKSQLAKPKQWEERFQELVEFKEEHGHTIVPQHSASGLGQWVHSQRQALKAFKAGQKSSMNVEKALKLSNLGFVIDVFELRKKQKTGGDDDSSYFSHAI